MYVPKQFAPPSDDALHDLIDRYPLATVVMIKDGGIDANHLPLHLRREVGSLGQLRGHVARANPLHREIADNTEVLAIFHANNAYISPSWYPTKAEDGKEVPTWNYAVVHAYGTLSLHRDPAWLSEHLAALTDHNEAGEAKPWRFTDAPVEFTAMLMTAIVGIEISITRLVGKWKMSQNQAPQNREGVIQGLRARARAGDAVVADWVEQALRRVEPG